ncbi:MAG: hypothetical protein V3U28_04830 [Candidatus Acidoferrales bacterium]
MGHRDFFAMLDSLLSALDTYNTLVTLLLSVALALAVVAQAYVAYRFYRLEKQREQIDLIVEFEWTGSDAAYVGLINNSRIGLAVLELFLEAHNLRTGDLRREQISRGIYLPPFSKDGVQYDVFREKLISPAAVLLTLDEYQVICEILIQYAGKRERYRQVVLGPRLRSGEYLSMKRVG